MGNILIIDDDPATRLLIRRVLENDGHIISEASDGLEGIKSYRENPVDLIITDLIMPGKEGLETISELKKEYPDIKIVAMTGRRSLHLETAKLLGAMAVFEKPFEKKALVSAIRNLLEKNE